MEENKVNIEELREEVEELRSISEGSRKKADELSNDLKIEQERSGGIETKEIESLKNYHDLLESNAKNAEERYEKAKNTLEGLEEEYETQHNNFKKFRSEENLLNDLKDSWFQDSGENAPEGQYSENEERVKNYKKIYEESMDKVNSVLKEYKDNIEKSKPKEGNEEILQNLDKIYKEQKSLYDRYRSLNGLLNGMKKDWFQDTGENAPEGQFQESEEEVIKAQKEFEEKYNEYVKMMEDYKKDEHAKEEAEDKTEDKEKYEIVLRQPQEIDKEKYEIVLRQPQEIVKESNLPVKKEKMSFKEKIKNFGKNIKKVGLFAAIATLFGAAAIGTSSHQLGTDDTIKGTTTVDTDDKSKVNDDITEDKEQTTIENEDKKVTVDTKNLNDFLDGKNEGPTVVVNNNEQQVNWEQGDISNSEVVYDEAPQIEEINSNDVVEINQEELANNSNTVEYKDLSEDPVVVVDNNKEEQQAIETDTDTSKTTIVTNDNGDEFVVTEDKDGDIKISVEDDNRENTDSMEVIDTGFDDIDNDNQTINSPEIVQIDNQINNYTNELNGYYDNNVNSEKTANLEKKIGELNQLKDLYNNLEDLKEQLKGCTDENVKADINEKIGKTIQSISSSKNMIANMDLPQQEDDFINGLQNNAKDSNQITEDEYAKLNEEYAKNSQARRDAAKNNPSKDDIQGIE